MMKTFEIKRFDAYEVSPVVQNTTPGGETHYEAFSTLTDAQRHIDEFLSKGTFDGIEGKCILWTLYGRREGIAEAIADRVSEEDAFELLYSITGIEGISGQRFYPVSSSIEVPERLVRALSKFAAMQCPSVARILKHHQYEAESKVVSELILALKESKLDIVVSSS